MQKRPRQIPVSCQLCRSMKLKCNRESPCSNCTSRGVPCERPYQAHASQSQQSTSTITDNEEVLTRLMKLEELILRLQHTPGPNSPSVADTWHPSDPSKTTEEGHVSRWLERAGTCEPSLITGLSNGIVFQILPIQSAVEDCTIDAEQSVKKIWLPSKAEAFCLFENYVEHIAYLHHVIHIPSGRSLVENVYEQILLGLPTEPGHVAVVLSIFATTTYMVGSFHTDRELFSNHQHAMKCASELTKAALDVLEHSHRTTSGSLEDIQATIILSFVIFNLEGFSTRFRSLSNRALSMARELSFHLLDAEKPRPALRKDGMVAIEIKRRVWWHIAATDWLLALSGGPQEGTYLINSDHMRVLRPSNVDDTSINGYEEDFDLPLSQPTAMTFSILRIRLAEICRNAVDALPIQFPELGRVDYDRIVFLDGQFEKFLQELPVFFRLDERSREASREIDQNYPQIPVQRYILYCTLHSRRLKLNQPFLTRSSLDRRYRYSREVCLRSARSVISIKQLLEQDTMPFAAAHIRLATFLHIFFLATAVLVMDLCFERPKTTTDKRWTEVAEACRVLQEAESSSPTAGLYLRPLIAVLNKHRIRLPSLDRTPTSHPNVQKDSETHPSISTSDGPDQNGSAQVPLPPAPASVRTAYPRPEIGPVDSNTERPETIDPEPYPEPVTTNWDVWYSSLDAGVPDLS